MPYHKVVKFPKAKKPQKPRLVLLEAGPKLTLERVIAFGTKFLGRPPTDEELRHLPE